ncbi:hypothetical protein IAU60_004240 [Kwoniella sp. DSM 27419]
MSSPTTAPSASTRGLTSSGTRRGTRTTAVLDSYNVGPFLQMLKRQKLSAEARSDLRTAISDVFAKGQGHFTATQADSDALTELSRSRKEKETEALASYPEESARTYKQHKSFMQAWHSAKKYLYINDPTAEPSWATPSNLHDTEITIGNVGLFMELSRHIMEHPEEDTDFQTDISKVISGESTGFRIALPPRLSEALRSETRAFSDQLAGIKSTQNEENLTSWMLGVQSGLEKVKQDWLGGLLTQVEEPSGSRPAPSSPATLASGQSPVFSPQCQIRSKL